MVQYHCEWMSFDTLTYMVPTFFWKPGQVWEFKNCLRKSGRKRKVVGFVFSGKICTCPAITKAIIFLSFRRITVYKHGKKFGLFPLFRCLEKSDNFFLSVKCKPCNLLDTVLCVQRRSNHVTNRETSWDILSLFSFLPTCASVVLLLHVCCLLVDICNSCRVTSGYNQWAKQH